MYSSIVDIRFLGELDSVKFKLCGDLVYKYEYYGVARDIHYSSQYYPNSDSQLWLRVQYKKYLDSRDKVIAEYRAICSKNDLPVCLSDVFLLTPEMFGLHDNSESNLKSTRRKLRDLILSNFGISAHLHPFPLFVTLTYRSPQFSPVLAKIQLKLFIKRLRYRLGINFRYIAVPEKHQSDKTAPDRYGSFHYHILIFDVDFINPDDCTDIWSYGYCYVKRCYGTPFHVAYYVTKYLSKDLSIQVGRRYLASFNCWKSHEITDLSTVPTLAFISSSIYPLLSGQTMRLTINKIKH